MVSYEDAIRQHSRVGPKHPFRAHVKTFAKATAELRKAFGLVSFTMVRGYWGSKYFSLSDHQGLVDAYWDGRLYERQFNKVDFVNKSINCAIKECFNLESEDNKAVLDAFHKVASFKGTFIYLKHYIGYTEIYVMTSQQDIDEFTSFFKKNKTAFNCHIRKIKSDCRDIIKGAKAASIQSTTLMPKPKDQASVEEPTLINEPVKRLRRYYLDGQFEDTYLSFMQVKCLSYLLQGYRYQEIADKIYLSRRTVEAHLNTIRLKLECDNKSQLIEKVQTHPCLMSVVREVEMVSYDKNEYMAEHVVIGDSCELISDPLYFCPESDAVKNFVDDNLQGVERERLEAK